MVKASLREEKGEATFFRGAEAKQEAGTGRGVSGRRKGKEKILRMVGGFLLV